LPFLPLKLIRYNLELINNLGNQTMQSSQSNLYELLQNQKLDFELLVTSDDKEALSLADILSYKGYKPYILSDLRVNPNDDLLPFSTELADIFKILKKYYHSNSPKKILISPLRTISFKLPKKECFGSFDIEFASEIDFKNLKDKLYNWGYYFVDIVSTVNEVSFRGDVIDIYAPNYDNPIRFSLFDTEIESIRFFDIASQKSYKEEIEKVSIEPAFFALSDDRFEDITKQIDEDDSNILIKDIHSLGFWHLGDLSHYLIQNLKSIVTYEALSEIEEAYIFDELRVAKEEFLSSFLIPQAKEYQDITIADTKDFISNHNNKSITILSNTQAKIDALELDSELIKNNNIKFETSSLIINILGRSDLIISLNKQSQKRRAKKPKFLIDELKIGEFVVHQNYGIGKFEAIEQVKILGGIRDFVKIAYQGDDKLLLPVENLNMVDRYVASSGMLPVIDKLGKGTFVKLKAKVKAKLFAIASDIIRLASLREVSKGLKIGSQKLEISLFQKSAGFEYTDDQKRSINEIFDDFESGKVMDRLLSGDVGFGKTEVALNAILATFLDGYQSLFIAPTTLLVNQHFETIRDRLAEFGVRFAKLNSKTSAKEKKTILQGLEDGTIDLVVGTHSLLNVKCKSLALIVVDEEHKFGVKQKEKLKSIRSNVHILSMSATPIPRTLNLALSKLKGMSKLETAPNERVGTRTYVKEYEDKVIKEIVLREKRRGGQIFYIYNNIATIEQKRDELHEILPELKIEIMHSKITPAQSDKILADFGDNKFDILLSTSIVESGLHLPNSNTIIIDGADRFGIADLHQLRGRVGRGNKEGFCYFLVNNKYTITPEATKRLSALESNSYLGSGSALAYFDLEIRGGGNIVGEAQSGNIKQIGYSLYLKMLEDALATLSGEMDDDEENIEVDIKLTIKAYISDMYISESRVRLELYRRLSQAKTKFELYEIQDEVEDRFGKLDEPTRQFFELIIIKILASNKNIKTVSNYGQNITITYNDGKKEVIKAKSKDDDDLIRSVLEKLN
jgi:transcription-repair coupling factor (superfamily II helicase)